MTMKEDNFADWYLDIVEKANLSDERYPIKGMNVWTPYGSSDMAGGNKFLQPDVEPPLRTDNYGRDRLSRIM